MNDSSFKKTIIDRFKKDGGPHKTGEKLGVSAFMLVMYAHGYSKPQKRTLEKLEKSLKGRSVKVVKKAARVKRAKK